MDEVHFRNIGNLSVFSHQIVDDIRVVRTHAFVIRNVGTYVVGRFAFPVYGIPGRVCIAFQHRWNPGMVFQSVCMGDFGGTGMLFDVESAGIVAHTVQSVLFPFLEIRLDGGFCSVSAFPCQPYTGILVVDSSEHEDMPSTQAAATAKNDFTFIVLVLFSDRVIFR